MIIDVHGHIGRMPDLQAELTAIDAYARGASIHRLLISNLRAASVGEHGANLHETDANVMVLDAAQRRPRFSAVYWARPGREDSHPQAVAGALETEPFAALLLSPKLNDFAIDDARVDPYVMAAARVNRTVLVLCGRDERSRPRRAYDLARRFPRMPVVLLNAHGEANIQEALECAQQAARTCDADLYLTTAHTPAEEIIAAVQALGSARVLFGADALGLGPSGTHAIRALVERLQRELPADAARAVLGANAQRLFPLSASA